MRLSQLPELLPWRVAIRGIEEIGGRIDSIAHHVGRIRAALEAPRAREPSFVCVLVEALTEEGALCTSGSSARIGDGHRHDFRMRAFQSCGPGCVTVFCDLERVRVNGIYMGADFLGCAMPLGGSPIARFDKWSVGIEVSVLVEGR